MDVVARLRKANAALREVVNTQAVQIETLTGQVTALSAPLAGQVARILETTLVGSPVSQARTSLVAHRLRPQTG